MDGARREGACFPAVSSWRGETGVKKGYFPVLLLCVCCSVKVQSRSRSGSRQVPDAFIPTLPILANRAMSETAANPNWLAGKGSTWSTCAWWLATHVQTAQNTWVLSLSASRSADVLLGRDRVPGVMSTPTESFAFCYNIICAERTQQSVIQAWGDVVAGNGWPSMAGNNKVVHSAQPSQPQDGPSTPV